MLEEYIEILYEVLISLLGMSVQASIVILVVLILRAIFQKAHISKKYVMLLWVIPFVCLVLPWRISSPLGVWENAPTEYQGEAKELIRAIGRGAEGIASSVENGYENEDWVAQLGNESVSNVVDGTNAEGNVENSDVVDEQPESGVNVSVSDGNTNVQIRDESTDVSSDGIHITYNTAELGGFSSINIIVIVAVPIIWCVGALGFALFSLINLGVLKWRLRKRIPIRKRIYLVDKLPIPIVVGIFLPKIYIPSGIEEEHLEYVISHEETHIRRKDTLMKVLAYFITCVHWFNPLVWLAYNLMVKDMEMACDEETIAKLGENRKKEYATALLLVASGKRNIFAVPLAFGEGNTRGRIMNILKYKRTKTILSVAALVICVLLAALFLTKGQGYVAGNTNDTQQADEQTKTLRLSMKDVYEAVLAGTVEKLNYRAYMNEEESIDLVAENYEIPITYNDENFVLYASYKKDAELPRKVELENKYGEKRSLYNEKNDPEESLFEALQTEDNFCTFIGMERNIVQEPWESKLNDSFFKEMKMWVKYVFCSETTDYSIWYEKYNEETLHRIVTDDGSAGPALCGDIVYYQSQESDVQVVLKTMIDSMIQPLMTPSDTRPYTITRYVLEEQPVIQVNENVWVVEFLNGYYEYDGKDMIDFETAREWEYAYAPREDGLVSFFRQGESNVFTYILLKDKDVYRLQLVSDMIAFYDDYMQGKFDTLDGLDIANEDLTHMQKVLLNREGFYGKLPFYEDKPKDWYMVEDCLGFDDYSSRTETSFCIVDMDHDGEEEVCVFWGGYVMFFHSKEDGIYGYHFAKSKVDEIYKDGSFINSYNFFFYGNASFEHNALTYEVITSKDPDADGNTSYYKYDESDSSQMGRVEITEEEYNEIMSEYEMEKVERYPLTVDNILKYVP